MNQNEPQMNQNEPKMNRQQNRRDIIFTHLIKLYISITIILSP